MRSHRRDPVKLLGEVPGRARLDELANDNAFLRRLELAVADLNGYVTDDRWFQTEAGSPVSSVAYFSPEFGITHVLPQYSGGLGILAGDHLKAASDLAVPLIGVGLLYRHGYFAQSLNAEGWQQERYPLVDPDGLPISLLRDGDAPATVTLKLPGNRELHAQIWVAQVGRVPLLMLDSDMEENDAGEREVTDRLYGGTTEHRLLQELLLGVGGVRAVRAYCRITGHPAPEVFHTNEGHAGFLGVERIRELAADQGLDFDTALEVARGGTVFTTHTPVPAGIDRFPVELVQQHFSRTRSATGSRSTASSSSAPRTSTAATRACSTWRSWGCGWPSGPTACPSCTVWSAAACSPGSGRASTRSTCRSPRSPTACTRRPGCPGRSTS